MEFIKTHIEDRILHVILDRGKSNAMHLEMINEMIEIVESTIQEEAIEGIIWSGKENFFTSGLDLITLYHYDEPKMREFWDRFMILIHTLFSYPKPMVCAITGHSPAGGCVLAICCDYRVMAEGEYVIGLNEIPVGIIVPENIFKLYSFWLGSGNAYRSLLSGKLFSPVEAKDIGLVDEVVPYNKIQISALRRIKSMTQFEKSAWQLSKRNFRKDLIREFNQDQSESISQVLEQWWRPSTRSILKTIIENLTQKKG